MKIFQGGINMKWLLFIGVIIIGIGYAVASVNPIISDTHSYLDIFHATYLYGDITNVTGVLPNASLSASALNTSIVRTFVFVKNTSAQTGFSDVVWTKINLNNEMLDYKGEFTNSRWTATKNAKIRFTGQILLDVTIASQQNNINIYKNGAAYIGSFRLASTTSGDTLLVVFSDEVLIGDYFELYFRCSSCSGIETVVIDTYLNVEEFI